MPNAGHSLPCCYLGEHAANELSARGMPLGLMPGMSYGEEEDSLEEEDGVLQHAAAREPGVTVPFRSTLRTTLLWWSVANKFSLSVDGDDPRVLWSSRGDRASLPE